MIGMHTDCCDETFRNIWLVLPVLKHAINEGGTMQVTHCCYMTFPRKPYMQARFNQCALVLAWSIARLKTRAHL